jgi:hypothetical protein
MATTTPVDPIKIPIISLTQEELADYRALVPNFDALYQDALAKNVFGHDAVRNRDGSYQEQGFGAKGRETSNHFAALKKAEAMGIELPGTYDRAVAEIFKRDPERAKKLGLQAPSR